LFFDTRSLRYATIRRLSATFARVGQDALMALLPHGSLIAYRFACGGLATFVDCRAATFTFATTITCEASSGTVA
jgi:hypothetical protein